MLGNRIYENVNFNKPHRRGVFITGGGAKGAFSIGYFKALQDQNEPYHVVCGTSAGALVGGAATYLRPDEMEDIWKYLTLKRVFGIDEKKIEGLSGIERSKALYKECFKTCLRGDSYDEDNPKRLLIDRKRVEDLLHYYLDPEAIMNSPIDFGITTTQLPSGKLITLFKKDMNDPLDGILASISLPVFTNDPINLIKNPTDPTKSDNHHYIDVLRSAPKRLGMLNDTDCDIIDIVDTEGKKSPHQIALFGETLRKVFGNDKEVRLIRVPDGRCGLDFTLEASLELIDAGYNAKPMLIKKM